MVDLTPVMLCKCLADDTRLSAVMLLSRFGEVCVCDLVSALSLPQPTVSRHLAQLRSCGIVQDRRAGQWVHYRLSETLPDWAFGVISQLTGAAAASRGALLKRAATCC
ncbi:arsenic resistance operon regulator [Alcanivorax sp. S71-1-4]|uniref:metalloregulator ArsR/SmtB family transcription factor n=1 Tax=Alcanivorax sp. S71-1-4 TaxID=1177159 RepID=UPI00135A29C9|nr:metalloregulator ArsR/SmtB family transcription factor [Alcanivorax sp. S71-1-4]KAF0810898.1 arsenic resistance operon regulator [Alcanivorax sp. S71-1-4]